MNAISEGRATVRRLLSAAVLPMAVLLASGCDAHAEDRSPERRLIEALADKDLDAARRALEQGADPEARLGPEVSDSAMCTAIDDRGTRYLELLLEHGASPDAIVDEGPRRRRTPLACAIDLYNPAAFELLLERNAPPNPNLCAECAPRFRHSAFTQALMQRKYPMALTLARTGTLTDGDIEKLVFVLEEIPYDSYHPWSEARRQLVEWVRGRNIPIDPEPGAALRPGREAPDCVFSTRDLIEGLDKGTICH